MAENVSKVRVMNGVGFYVYLYVGSFCPEAGGRVKEIGIK